VSWALQNIKNYFRKRGSHKDTPIIHKQTIQNHPEENLDTVVYYYSYRYWWHEWMMSLAIDIPEVVDVIEWQLAWQGEATDDETRRFC